ncbi:unnamed protein product, partial [Chrysoparadoxa australica]
GWVPDDQLYGKSLVPALKGETAEGKAYAFSIHTTRGINDGSDHYGVRTVVNEKFRYILNLTPEQEFLNTINNDPEGPERWFTSWSEKAEQDAEAANWLEKYKHRPKEELYQIINDKWCLVNLAEYPSYSEIKRELSNELEKWMLSCGDQGQATEMAALDHMWKNRKE